MNVALLAEGVDRNSLFLVCRNGLQVALLAEGVDRNARLIWMAKRGSCRPPRGGRG